MNSAQSHSVPTEHNYEYVLKLIRDMFVFDFPGFLCFPGRPWGVCFIQHAEASDYTSFIRPPICKGESLPAKSVDGLCVTVPYLVAVSVVHRLPHGSCWLQCDGRTLLQRNPLDWKGFRLASSA